MSCSPFRAWVAKFPAPRKRKSKTSHDCENKLWVEKRQHSRSSSKVEESETKWSWTQPVPGSEGNLLIAFFGLLSLSCKSGSSRIFSVKAPWDWGPGKEFLLKCWKVTRGLRTIGAGHASLRGSPISNDLLRGKQSLLSPSLLSFFLLEPLASFSYSRFLPCSLTEITFEDAARLTMTSFSETAFPIGIKLPMTW